APPARPPTSLPPSATLCAPRRASSADPPRRRSFDFSPLKPPTRCATSIPAAKPATAPTRAPTTIAVDDESSSRWRNRDIESEPLWRRLLQKDKLRLQKAREASFARVQKAGHLPT